MRITISHALYFVFLLLSMVGCDSAPSFYSFNEESLGRIEPVIAPAEFFTNSELFVSTIVRGADVEPGLPATVFEYPAVNPPLPTLDVLRYGSVKITSDVYFNWDAPILCSAYEGVEFQYGYDVSRDNGNTWAESLLTSSVTIPNDGATKTVAIEIGVSAGEKIRVRPKVRFFVDPALTPFECVYRYRANATHTIN